MQPLVDLVQEEMGRFASARAQHPNLFSESLNLHPIPFFGNLVNAHVLTLALNPSETEFRTHRVWPRTLDAPSLTGRLVNYFDLAEAEPHHWFDTCAEALSLIGCSYHCNAAHLDLFSYPTKFLKKMAEAERAAFANIVRDSVRSMMCFLRMCKSLKLIIVVDYTIPSQKNAKSCLTFDFICTSQHPLASHIKELGAKPPVFRGGSIGGLIQRIRVNRASLRDHLKSEHHWRFSK
jgi:hypothetical protein